ncbi:hypothetical protein [Saccharomonospora piscinae]|uniref:hypothetical protein n=1 Tax=Saccharomonospora piscinae TaxID=687388 RepID=UPI0012DCFFA1
MSRHKHWAPVTSSVTGAQSFLPAETASVTPVTPPSEAVTIALSGPFLLWWCVAVGCAVTQLSERVGERVELPNQVRHALFDRGKPPLDVVFRLAHALAFSLSSSRGGGALRKHTTHGIPVGRSSSSSCPGPKPVPHRAVNRFGFSPRGSTNT